MVDNKKAMQLELLMEKLRHKTSNLNLADSAKAFRMTLLEKRYANDVVEKSQYQKCLDLLQTNMKVTSLQSMLERLESISRQSGLKFTADGSGRAFFISSDMFYLEVIVEQSGAVREVHIQHEGRSEPHTCNEIATCLNSGNFSKFTSHLQGLCAIYQVSADKKLKSKAFAALSALEMDLNSMSKLQFNNQDVASLVHKSPLGIVVPRVGGQPLTMTYFITPYALLNCQSPNIKVVIEKIMEKKLGISCTVGIDSSTNLQLPTQALLSVSRNSDGDSVPTFSTLNANNSMSLPATFVLRMGEPLILCKAYANQIRTITGVEVGCWDHPEYLFSSLVKTISNGLIELTYDGPLITKALRVILPDQSHSYYVTESEEVAVKCCSISSVSFTHPSQVPQILSILRRQAILSTLLSSCIRPRSQSDASQSISFEINAITLNHLAVSFEHPVLEKMCCLEIDLGLDPSCIQCCLYITEEEVSMASNEFATKVLQKCLSIPVTMRALLRQMQATSSRFSTSTTDHSGPFERRFNSQLNGGDLDSHSSSNGQYGSSSLSGGAGSGSGSFDRGHSPRTHSSGNGSGVDSTMLHSSTPKEVGSIEMEHPEEVSLIDEAIEFTDKNKTGFGSQSSEAWTSLQANADISLYSANSADSGLGLSLSSTAFQMVPNQHASDATDTKSDESPEMDVSMLETDLGDVLPGTEGDEDAQNQSPIEAEPRSQKGETKLGVYPSVSITPVTSLPSSSRSTGYHNKSFEQRPGIEIIPFSGKDSSSSGIPSSLTITPVGTKTPKEKSKYKEFRLSGEGHSYDAEKKERKRRREDDKTSSPSSGDRPNKIVCVNSTLMGPPSLLKADASPKRSNSSSSQGTNSASISPMASPSRSSSKNSTPSSSPKHLSPGGKPSMSTLSMSAFKSANSPLAGSLSPSNSTSSSSSSKSKKSRDRDRERSDKERDRDKDKDRNRSRERSRDREKKSRTPTPTSSNNLTGVSGRGPALVKTKSLDFSPSLKDDANDDKEDLVFNSLFGLDPSESDAVQAHIDPSNSVGEEVRSMSPAPDAETYKGAGNLGSLYDSTSLTGGNPNKSPNRCRKSSLSAVIDKLRLQHNPETDVFQTGGGGPKYSADLHTMKMENDNNDSKNLSDSKSNARLEGRSDFIEDYEEDKSDSSRSPKANEAEEGVHFDRMDSESNSPTDPFSQDDSGINETVDTNGGEMNGDSLNKEFARPFPPPSSRSSYRYRSGDTTDLNPNSPSVSVHIVNVPSPLALQQTRSPLANQLALVNTASASPASSTSQSSPCVIDDDLMDEVLKL